MKGRWTVGADEAGETLAAFLRRKLPSLAWSRARALCERGKVDVAGEPSLDPAARVKAGQDIALDEHRPARVAKDEMAAIVYEDPQVVVIDKPSGVSSVPYEKKDSGTAMDLIRAAWRQKGKRATQTPLHVVHRIDKETSGLLMFAKTKAAERALGELFRKHDVERTYLCVAHGKVTALRLESRLVTDRGDGLRGSTRRPNQGKRAVTHVTPIRSLAEATLCEVRLETGKTHQIRIHLSETGHPLVGERVYIRDFTRKGHEPIESTRLLLHAATLGFRHPVDGKLVELKSPLPEDFEAMLKRLSR